MSILKSINEGFERRYGKLLDDRKQKEVKECDGECKGKKAEKELTEAPIYGLEAQHDSRKSFGGKAQVETDNAGTETLYSYNTPVVKIVKGEVTLLPKWDSSATTLRHVREFLKQHDLKAESKEQIAKDYGEKVDEDCKKEVKECDEKDSKGAVVRRHAMKEACKKDKKPIKEYKDMGQDLGEYQKWVDYDMKRYHKISDKTMDKIKEAGLTVVKDQYGDYEVIAHEPVRECDDKEARRRAIVKEAIDRTRAKRLQEAKKRTAVKKKTVNEPWVTNYLSNLLVSDDNVANDSVSDYVGTVYYSDDDFTVYYVHSTNPEIVDGSDIHYVVVEDATGDKWIYTKESNRFTKDSPSKESLGARKFLSDKDGLRKYFGII